MFLRFILNTLITKTVIYSTVHVCIYSQVHNIWGGGVKLNGGGLQGFWKIIKWGGRGQNKEGMGGNRI